MSRLVSSLFLTLVAWLCCGAGPSAEPPPINDVNPFRRSYLSLELSRNYPLSFSQNRFEPGPVHPVVGYRHDLDEHWLLGIGGQFKIFERVAPKDGHEMALWTIYHETLYAIRLEHPNYLIGGLKLLYLLPSRAARLPLQRDDELRMEIGAALSVALVRVVDDKWLVSLRMDRWRGTATQRLHGLEVAFGVSYALD